MKPAILGLHVSMACLVQSTMTGVQPMISPPFIPPPAIYGCGTTHGAVSSIEWNGPKTCQRSHPREFAKEFLLGDGQKEEVFSRDGSAKEVPLDDVPICDGQDKEILLDDSPEKQVLTADSHAIKESQNLRDRRKVLQSSTTTPPEIEPPMQRTHYTAAQVERLKERIRHRIIGTNYKYDVENDNFHELDKSDCDCSGCCGRIKVFDSKHPDQLVHDTGCCYCRGRLRAKNQIPLGESCLYLAVLCPLYAWLQWLQSQR